MPRTEPHYFPPSASAPDPILPQPPRPTKAFCDCCGAIHTDLDTDGELLELCADCQAELAAFIFEQACDQ